MLGKVYLLTPDPSSTGGCHRGTNWASEQVGFLKYAWMTQDTHLKATRVPDIGTQACTFPAFPSWEVISLNRDLIIVV